MHRHLLFAAVLLYICMLESTFSHPVAGRFGEDAGQGRLAELRSSVRLLCLRRELRRANAHPPEALSRALPHVCGGLLSLGTLSVVRCVSFLAQLSLIVQVVGGLLKTDQAVERQSSGLDCSFNTFSF